VHQKPPVRRSWSDDDYDVFDGDQQGRRVLFFGTAPIAAPVFELCQAPSPQLQRNGKT
jgi:hypothetical protein